MRSSDNFFPSNSFIENGFLKTPYCHNGNFDLWGSYPVNNTYAAITSGNSYFASRWRLNSLNLPAGISFGLNKESSFITSTFATTFSSFCAKILNNRAITSIASGKYLAVMQKHTYYSIREALDSGLTFSGNVATNISGTYAAFVYFLDNVGQAYFCQLPITFQGTNNSEYFEVTFPPMPTTANLNRNDTSVSMVYGVCLASGNVQTTGGFLPPVAENALIMGVPGQSNLFAVASSTFSFTNFNLRRQGSQLQINKTPYWLEKICVSNYPDTL